MRRIYVKFIYINKIIQLLKKLLLFGLQLFIFLLLSSTTYNNIMIIFSDDWLVIPSSMTNVLFTSLDIINQFHHVNISLH